MNWKPKKIDNPGYGFPNPKVTNYWYNLAQNELKKQLEAPVT